MRDAKHIRIEQLEKLLDENDSVIEIHVDGTVTVDQVVGPPKALMTYRMADVATNY